MGAVSYILYGDPSIGLLTPAGGMVKLFDLPPCQPSSSAWARYPRTARLPGSARRNVARAEGVSQRQVSRQANLLPTPIGVSGLTPRVLKKFRKLIRRLKLNAVVVDTSSAPKPSQAAANPLQPGQP